MGLPLAGKRIVLTRTAAGNRAWAKELIKAGAETYSLPSIETRSVEPTPKLKQALSQLEQFDWLVFTSAAGVRHAQDLISHLGIVPPTLAVAVVGEQTAAEAHKAGLHVTFQPSKANAETLAAELSPVEHKRILLLRSNIAAGEISAIFQKRGAIVTDLAIYATKRPSESDPAFSQLLGAGHIDYLTFASPSAVRGFIQYLTPADLALAQTLPAIAIGPSVSAALDKAGFNHIHTTPEPSIVSIIQTFEHLAKRSS